MKVIEDALKEGRTTLDVWESRIIFQNMGIPMTIGELAKSENDASEIFRKIGGKAVMKIASPDIIHKTDVGGVILNIVNNRQAREAYNQIVKNVKKKTPNARIRGVVVEKMESGIELIIGTTEDPQFGDLIMLGIGGTFVEIYKDVTFRLIPIEEKDAYEMMNELKGKKMLDGPRGMPKVDRKELASILVKVSDAILNNDEIKELDINPLMATEEGLLSVDARVILKK